jgi:hypothetical protein
MTDPSDSFAVRFGPAVFGVTGASFALADPESLLPPFLADSLPDFKVHVQTGDVPRSEWRFSRVESVSVDEAAPVVHMRLTEWEATMDLERRVAEARLKGAWIGALDSLFKTLVQLVLLHDGTGAMFHGASVVMDGVGYLFVGRSGAGKTTVADLSETVGAQVLSEEIACVSGFGEGGGLVLESVPLRHRRRRVVLPCRVPLAGVFDLVQAERDAVVPLSRGEALGALMRSVTVGVRHERFLSRAFVMMDDMLDRTPVCALEFRKTAAFWQAIDRAVGPEGCR